MKTHTLALSALCLATCAAHSATMDEVFDTVDSALTFDAFHGAVRMRLSGLIDLEAYSLPQPAPGLFFTERYSLFNPRLTFCPLTRTRSCQFHFTPLG